MRIRKLLSLALMILLAAGLLAGCRNMMDEKETASNSQQDIKGRYIEKEISLPENASEAVGMFWKDDKLTVYMKSKDNTPVYQSYTYEDHIWSQPQEESWMEDASRQLEGTESGVVHLGRNGKVYEVTETASDRVPYGSHIYTPSKDGTSAIDLTPKDLLIKNDQGSSERVVDFEILKDGTIALSCMSNNLIKFYKDEDKINEIESQEIISDQLENISLSDDHAAIISENAKNIDFYNPKNFKKIGSVKVGFDEDDTDRVHLASGTGKSWFFVDSHGIHRVQEDGKFVETVFDAKNGMMGLKDTEIQDFCVKDDNFYILYKKGENDEYHLEEYVYDEKASTVSSRNLSIYGLRDSGTVNQAVHEFQRSHSDVNIDYKSAVGAEQMASSDVIRNLNAELLNKQGADILILDGLPLDSYMKKGILADMTDLLDPLKKKGVLMDVIGNTAQKDNRTYALPARLCVPYVYGTKEERDAVSSVDALHEYMKKHPDQPLFGVTLHSFLGRTLLSAMYDEIIEKDGSVNEKKLSELLADWLKICQVSKTSETEKQASDDMDLKRIGVDFQSGINFFAERFACIDEGMGLNSLKEPFSRMEQKGVAYESIKQLYVPKVIVGVNASSKNQKLAKEFIQTMYSDSVQEIDTSEGFPVTEKGLQFQAAYVETEAAKKETYGQSGVNALTGKEETMDTHYPDRAAVEQLNTLIQELKTPFLPDEILMDTMLKEMENCYARTKTPEETARAISQNVDTYLAE